MTERVLYLFGVVAVGALVTFGLRALPFVIARLTRKDSACFSNRAGAVISPIVIFALILYAYKDLELTTPWPYIAGVITIALQIWKGKAILSIIAGTVFYMAVIANAGCVTVNELEYDANKPLLRFTNKGIMFKEMAVTPAEAIELLEKNNVPKDKTLHILVDADYTDKRAPWVFQRNYLARNGWTRSILVHSRKWETESKLQKEQNKGRTTSSRMDAPDKL